MGGWPVCDRHFGSGMGKASELFFVHESRRGHPFRTYIIFRLEKWRMWQNRKTGSCQAQDNGYSLWRHILCTCLFAPIDVVDGLHFTLRYDPGAGWAYEANFRFKDWISRRDRPIQPFTNDSSFQSEKAFGWKHRDHHLPQKKRVENWFFITQLHGFWCLMGRFSDGEALKTQ